MMCGYDARDDSVFLLTPTLPGDIRIADRSARLPVTASAAATVSDCQKSASETRRESKKSIEYKRAAAQISLQFILTVSLRRRSTKPDSISAASHRPHRTQNKDEDKQGCVRNAPSPSAAFAAANAIISRPPRSRSRPPTRGKARPPRLSARRRLWRFDCRLYRGTS